MRVTKKDNEMEKIDGVEVRKLPDGPATKSYRRGYGFTGVCTGSKSARRSKTLSDHYISKTTSPKPVKEKKLKKPFEKRGTMDVFTSRIKGTVDVYRPRIKG